MVWDFDKQIWFIYFMTVLWVWVFFECLYLWLYLKLNYCCILMWAIYRRYFNKKVESKDGFWLWCEGMWGTRAGGGWVSEVGAYLDFVWLESHRITAGLRSEGVGLTWSNHVLSISKDGGSTTPLGNCFQCSVILMVKSGSWCSEGPSCVLVYAWGLLSWHQWLQLGSVCLAPSPSY